jgi:hypothetical protein
MFDKKQTRREFLKFSAWSSFILMGLPSALTAVQSINLLGNYDEMLCRKKFKFLADDRAKSMSIGDAIIDVGRSFLGTEYVAGTLDKSINENLVINLTGLDCVTFVENCLTFARCVKNGRPSYDAYKAELEKIRYRDGKIDGFSSRLNYFCDWIYNNEEKGIVKDITADIGGITYGKKINFMSTHTQFYKQLADRVELDNILVTEDAINRRHLYYIPKKNIHNHYSQIQNGDIIATTTAITGLDVTHTGYAQKDKRGTYFMHASSKWGKVIISDTQLEEYIFENSTMTGIMVARPQKL